MTPAKLGVDHSIEEEGNKVGEVVRMKMREQKVRDLVPIDPSLDQIHQGAGAEIEEEVLIGAHQIPGRSTGGMDVRSGTENG